MVGGDDLFRIIECLSASPLYSSAVFIAGFHLSGMPIVIVFSPENQIVTDTFAGYFFRFKGNVVC